jgi:hypothetical protein
MASPSRPFQSQVMTQAVRFYHRLKATGARWLRSGQATVQLWTQVALYPAYAAFQATRVTLRKAQAVTTHWRDRLRLPSRRVWQLSLHSQLTADWAIQQALSVVLPSTSAMPKAVNTTVNSHHALYCIDDGALQVKPSQFPADLQVCGLASCLEHRSLVLVGTDNHVVDGLSADQQAAIATLISQLMAAYSHWQRRQQRLHRLQAGPLPLPVVSAQAWWPVRVMIWLMAWMQTGTVAAAANLFQEAESRYSLPPRLGPFPLPGSPDSSQRSRLSQSLAWLNRQIGDPGLVQSCLRAVRSVQPRLAAVSASLRPYGSVMAAPKSLPPQSGPGLIGPFKSAYWRGAHPLWRQALWFWIFPQKEAMSPAASSVMADVSRLVSREAVKDAIAPVNLVSASTVWSNDAPSSAVDLSNVTVRKAVFATVNAESDGEDWINVEVLAVEYLERPLRQLLRWLDRGLVWLERALQWLWSRGLEPLLLWLDKGWQWLWQRLGSHR